MRNEAKYVCCLGGFLGFISFFTISLLLGEDVLAAVIRGSVGCLFCSICARGILHLVLEPLVTAKNGARKETDEASPSLSSDEETPPSTEEIVQESAEAATTDALSEASPAAIEPAAA